MEGPVVQFTPAEYQAFWALWMKIIIAGGSVGILFVLLLLFLIYRKL